MSRVQTKANGYAQQKKTQQQVTALGRVTGRPLVDVNTSGLTSAQIDQKVFVGTQGGGSLLPYDGILITDKTNSLLLVRVSGKWGKTSLTLIS